jgi:hypothetical protein
MNTKNMNINFEIKSYDAISRIYTYSARGIQFSLDHFYSYEDIQDKIITFLEERGLDRSQLGAVHNYHQAFESGTYCYFDLNINQEDNDWFYMLVMNGIDI